MCLSLLLHVHLNSFNSTFPRYGCRCFVGETLYYVDFLKVDEVLRLQGGVVSIHVSGGLVAALSHRGKSNVTG